MRKRSRRATFAALLLGVLTVAPDAVRAYPQTAAIPLFLDPSVSSAGRGRASTAAFWEDGPNYWANPALLAYHHGVRFERGRTQLVPDLTDDVYFRRERWSVGAYGIAVASSDRPYRGVGRQRLEYGESQATDATGVPLYTFESTEEIRMVAGAASAGVLLAQLAPGVGHGGLPLVRYADAAAGYTSKIFRSELTPFEESATEAKTRDWGVFARVTPFDTSHPWFSPRLTRVLPARFDIAYGKARLNGNDAALTYVMNGYPNPIGRMDRSGWSTHLALGLPGSAESALRSGGAGWLADVLTPWLRWGYDWDRSRINVRNPETGVVDRGSEFADTGWELTALNVFTIRRGRVEDWDGRPFGHGRTKGWGLGMELGDLGGFRYDEATTPQAEGLVDTHPKGFSVYVDPLEIWRSTVGD